MTTSVAIHRLASVQALDIPGYKLMILGKSGFISTGLRLTHVSSFTYEYRDILRFFRTDVR
jgi:hypothetical protein